MPPSARSASSASQRRSALSSAPASMALVKWEDGVYAGTYTHDVNTEWILGFNARSPAYPETYAIEWRNGSRPRQGWPVYNGVVLDVSSDIEYLRSQKNSLEEGQDSTRQSTGNQSSRQSPPCTPVQPLDINSEVVRELLQRLRGGGRDRSMRKDNDKENESPNTEEKVLVSTSLWVSKHAYIQARQASSPGRMLRPLLRQAFSRRKLIASSYAGQSRTINGIVTSKPGLKKYRKMADIHTFILDRFPHMPQATFGGLVNSFLGAGPNTIRTLEFIDDSESEED